MQQQGAAATATLMDTDGKVGRAYGARVTPHMYVIDAQGRLVYAGAIDSVASARPADIDKATNHVKQALAEVAAGNAVSVPTTQAYGCTIKYADG
jgi:formylmethanofuran dehydrogenase subunit A